MKPQQYFDKIFCINLDERKDRWDRCQEIFSQLNLDVERMPGVHGASGWNSEKYPHPARAFEGVAAGTQAHLNVLDLAFREKIDKVLILEDDIEFIEGFIDLFDQYSDYIPEYWEMFYLGGMYRDFGGFKPQPVNRYVARVSDMMSTHAYAIRYPLTGLIYTDVISTFPNLIDSMDGYLTRYQKVHEAYAFICPMAWQRADHSSIQNAHRDYTSVFKRKLL